MKLKVTTFSSFPYVKDLLMIKRTYVKSFIEFRKCTWVTGKGIANQIIHIVQKVGLDIKDYRGQVYNGASNVSSEAVGAQVRIKVLCEKAVYTHCCGHNLSLVVVSACKLPVIRNVLDKVQQITQMFIKGSKK